MSLGSVLSDLISDRSWKLVGAETSVASTASAISSLTSVQLASGLFSVTFFFFFSFFQLRNWECLALVILFFSAYGHVAALVQF